MSDRNPFRVPLRICSCNGIFHQAKNAEIRSAIGDWIAEKCKASCNYAVVCRGCGRVRVSYDESGKTTISTGVLEISGSSNGR